MGQLPTQTYHKIKRQKVDFDALRARLKVKHLNSKRIFSEKYPHVEKFFLEKGLDLGKIREHSAKLIGVGAIAGRLLLSPPSPSAYLPPPQEIIEKLKIKGLATESGTTAKSELVNTKKILVGTFESLLPERPRPLTRVEEKFLEAIFQKTLGVPTRANLEGEHLNTTYGLIGAEQHLRRFPGDTLSQHGSGDILRSGVAPGLGAWGYFAASKGQMNEHLEEAEKWYAVVQTLYLPDWNKRQPYLKNWYKYRKVLIVNTQNGNAVVAAIADAGPAAWTGKHFGGSPEVMQALGGSKYKKGPVILFFVDDAENEVSLGPVEYNLVK